MQDYLTKPKIILKKEENYHIFHQQIPQQKTEYSPGISAETNKTRGKPETIHSPTNATNKHNKYSESGVFNIEFAKVGAHLPWGMLCLLLW